MPRLKVLRPGMLTTVQDCGRRGHQARGVPVSGAMDVYSHRLANLLVGNDESAATLEITLLGPQLEFDSHTRFALTGAAFTMMLDAKLIPMNESVEARPGSCLRFGDRMRGARAYLAVQGGIDVPIVLNSRSTHIVSAMGGYQGRALRAGDMLPFEKGSGSFNRGLTPLTLAGVRPLLTPGPLFLPDGGARLRVIPGEYGDLLAGKRYIISPQSNRMGYRLDGPSLSTGAREMLSSAVPTGTVQVPAGGQPILLMNDHATVGGYPIAATVITADLSLAGQLAPGDWIEFEPCSLDIADSAYREQERRFHGDAV